MADMPQAPDRNLALELVRVTEAGALAASAWVGRGQKEFADGAAVDAMRAMLNTVSMDGVIVIGEGEKDEAPMLFNGEQLGTGSGPAVDIAVDPIEGTSPTAFGRPNAMSVIAVAERGAMFDPGPCLYMDKMAAGRDAVGVIDISRTPTENLLALADARHASVRDMTAVVLNRPRHAELIAEIRETGARIRLIEDNDVGAAISTAWPDSGVDILFGVGGSPEAVISATALRCMGGMFQARLWPRNEREREAAIAGGFPLGQALGIDDLVSSDNCFFAATGVTHGDLLAGVRVDGAHVWTESLAMRSRSGTVRKFVSRHRHE